MAAAQPTLHIEPGVVLSWPTIPGNTYQAQESQSGIAPWADLGSMTAGDGETHSIYQPMRGGARFHQVLETVPGVDPVAPAPVNGGFEIGSELLPASWTRTSNQPPERSAADARSGSFSLRCSLENVGNAPSEGGLNQLVVAQGGTIQGGRSYDFSFWARQVSSGPSYVQQYQVQWLDGSNGVLGGTDLTSFNGVTGSWVKISDPGLVAPASTVEARISFRFVTGAVTGGHGEVLIDDVLLDGGTTGTGSPPETHTIPVVSQPVAKISWLSEPGVLYQPASSTDLLEWIEHPPGITGDGGNKEIMLPTSGGTRFFRLGIPLVIVQPPSNLHVVPAGVPDAIGLAWNASASSGVTGYRIRYGTTSGEPDEFFDVANVTTAIITGLVQGTTYFISVAALTANGESPAGAAVVSTQAGENSGIVALFDSGTVPEPDTTVDTPTALITRLADRARDRHAREGNFSAYDHYLSWYWEQRVANIEIIDRVARGGSGITFNFTTQDLLNPAEFRAHFRGIGTVAEYYHNVQAAFVSSAPSATPGETDYLYTATLNSKQPENRPLQTGDRVEVEVSQFLQAPRNGRSNYYGTAFLYVVGQGVVPWQAVGPLLDSHPLPENAWLGGLTTLPYQYSNEPEHRFKQTAGNISPTNGQPFMSGRRLHHTDFGSGAHSEPGNPVFTQQAGKLGPKFVARSCVECHVNNGRALPPAVGSPLLHSVVKVGSDAGGSPHPLLGGELQPNTIGGSPEGGATLAGYTNTDGTYGDGTTYSLRKPNYAFQGVNPGFFSVRIAPQLVGLGLLEAVSEDTILAHADPDDADLDGISGRHATTTDPESGVPRLGRFTYKSAQAKVMHQIAYALNNDMSVTTSLFPVLDGETTTQAPEISDGELDEMNRYVSLLGVGARRDLTDADTLRGETLFQTASCTGCHLPVLTTGPHHPMAELRNQTIRPFTDLLLHDMGPGLADNMGEDGVSGSEWRTSPLWNIGLTAGVSGGEAYLHDGRARTLEEAILWHGGEAEASKEAFRNMPAADRAAIIKFLKSL